MPFKMAYKWKNEAVNGGSQMIGLIRGTLSYKLYMGQHNCCQKSLYVPYK